MATIRTLAAVAFFALVACPVVAHHAAEGIVDEEIYAMIDAMVADTPHADLVFDDMGGGMTEIDITTPVQDLEQMVAAGLLDAVAMLDGDPIGMLRKLCACWPNVAHCLEGDSNPDEVCPPDTPATHYGRWLWSRIEPEPEPIWAEIAGLPDAPHVRRAMHTLQQIGAVFPDGTLSALVWDYLRARSKERGVEVEQVP